MEVTHPQNSGDLSHRTSCAALVSLVSAQSFAQGQPSVVEKLVVGDWYEITIERHGVKENLRGHLVQLTDEWIVLGSIGCMRRKPEVPWLGEMPYLGQYFRKVDDINFRAFTWVPRKDAVIDKRTPCSDQSDFQLLAEKLPTLENGFSLCWVENNKRIEDGKFSDATHRHIQVTRVEHDAATRPDPQSNKFPSCRASLSRVLPLSARRNQRNRP